MAKTISEYTLEVMNAVSWYNQWLFSLVEKHLKGEILEAGAGIGNFTNLLRKKGHITAIDIRKDYLEKLKNKFKNKISLGYGDIEKGTYFFSNKRFDSVVCMNVLEHIKNQQDALINIRNLLGDDGILTLLVPAHNLLYSQFDKELGHFRRYNKRSLKNILEINYFKIISLYYVNWWAALGWFIFLKTTRSVELPVRYLSVFKKIGKPLLLFEKVIKPPFGLSVLAIAKKI